MILSPSTSAVVLSLLSSPLPPFLLPVQNQSCSNMHCERKKNKKIQGTFIFLVLPLLLPLCLQFFPFFSPYQFPHIRTYTFATRDMVSGTNQGRKLYSSGIVLGLPKVPVCPTFLCTFRGFRFHSISVSSLPGANMSIFQLLGRKIVDIRELQIGQCCIYTFAVRIVFFL